MKIINIYRLNIKKYLIKGFSLVEIMIAMAIGGILIVMFMGIIKNMKRIESEMLDRQDMMDLISIIKINSHSYYDCRAMLGFDEKNGESIPMEGEFSKIKNSINQEIAVVGKEYGRLTIDSIKYSPAKDHFLNIEKYQKEEDLEPITTLRKEGIINLKINFISNTNKKGIVKRIPINVMGLYYEDKWSLRNCFTINSRLITNISRDVATQVCLSFDGIYNFEKQRCEFDFIKNLEKTTNEKLHTKIDNTTSSVMVRLCASFNTSYDTETKKCKVDFDNYQIRKVHPRLMDKLIEKLMRSDEIKSIRR